MKAIFKKELKGYFLSPIGYIFVGVFMLLSAMFFLTGPIAYQVADISLLFSKINIVYLFLVSILTMRLLAEEKNKKTDQLLLTAPVSIPEIVVGKYLAAMSVFGITLAVSLVFPITLFLFGQPPVGEMIGSYVGFILLWGAFVAIGVFISSLTENQMISAVATFGVLLLVYFMEWIAGNFSNPILFTVAQWLSLLNRFYDFQNGILNITNIIYYLSVIFVFLFLTVRVIEKRRYS
ncbi:MAG: ABC transporter permease subunit [Clostridia bacterium]|nr:ABC transporter permease subunit [Clostridia bacterium]